MNMPLKDAALKQTAKCFLICILPVTPVTACSGGTKPPPPIQVGQTLVTGRSISPADIRAPGIQVPESGQFSFSVGRRQIVITSSNWNTIIGASTVVSLVGVMFSNNFNTIQVTRNRFQYLADLISEYYKFLDFEPLTVVNGISNHQFVDIAALYNPTTQVKKLSGLSVTIVARPSGRPIASEVFFATPASALVIPGQTIYFDRLTFQVPPNLGASHRSFTTNFHWASITNCHGDIC
jgi:hypothetical protein